MCSNYEPVTSADRLLAYFGARADGDPPQVVAWPLSMAPFIRLAEDGSGNRRCELGQYGLLPHFATELAFGRKTYNARSETVDKLPSFRDAWKRGQRCIIPAERMFEPCWETGHAVRWAIQHPGQAPLALAGIYRQWTGPEGQVLFTFAMLTVNADGHPVMQRFHRPGEEKRMAAILADDELADWLACPVEQASQFLRPWPGELDCYPAPLPPRTKLPRAQPRRSGQSGDTTPDDPDEPLLL